MNLEKPVLTGIGKRRILVQIRLDKGGKNYAENCSQFGDAHPGRVNPTREEQQLGEEQGRGEAHHLQGGEEELGHLRLGGGDDGGNREFGRGEGGVQQMKQALGNMLAVPHSLEIDLGDSLVGEQHWKDWLGEQLSFEEESLSSTEMTSQTIAYMLSNLEPVPMEQIPQQFVANPLPDGIQSEVRKIADKTKVKQAKNNAKPKMNRNQSLREEQAKKAIQFKENIFITKTSDGTKFYQCKLCQVNIHLILEWITIVRLGPIPKVNLEGKRLGPKHNTKFPYYHHPPPLNFSTCSRIHIQLKMSA